MCFWSAAADESALIFVFFFHPREMSIHHMPSISLMLTAIGNALCKLWLIILQFYYVLIHILSSKHPCQCISTSHWGYLPKQPILQPITYASISNQNQQVLRSTKGITACLAGAYVVNQRKHKKPYFLLSFINHPVILIISAHVMKKVLMYAQ